MPLWLLAWHVLIGAIWLYIFASATALSGAQSIYLDERGGALPVDQIQYSAWLVGERKGIAFRVAGATDQGCIQEGIVIRRASNEEWDGLPEQFRNAGAVSADCGEHAVVLVFHPRVKIWQGLIDHELLHAAGCWNHHFSLNDTLNASAKGPFSVTYQDANCRITADMWTIDDPDPCFAELAPDWTLYIPAIAGVRAKLLYEGVVDGGHQWGEPEVAPSIGTCVGFGVNDGTATLPNIKAYTGMVMSAQLVRTADGKWRLP